MPNHAPVRVLIADDHLIFREAMRQLLQAEAAFEVVGEAADGAQAVKLVAQLLPDILLLDLDMPLLSGMGALRTLQQQAIPCRTILVTADIEETEISEALQLGARGIMMKSAPVGLLFLGIRAVMAGDHWVGNKRVSDLSQYFQSTEEAVHSAKRTFGLTPRELQVICAVVAGDSNKEIAQRLSISQDTTKHHLSNIFDKLGVSNRLELALFAHNHRLIDRKSFGAGVQRAEDGTMADVTKRAAADRRAS